MRDPNKPDMSCARVKGYKASEVGAIERHNERKNDSYDNINVELDRIPLNVHYRKPDAESYMETLRKMEADGKISTRGLRKDATLFDEIIIDVNTMYFEKHGGYEYAREFYEEAFRFVEKKFGAENVVSAVMHADEINKAATEEFGKPVYHYHLHAVVLPVVDKEILWSKRCKDEALRGTVREVVHQISHSKKWASNIPMLDEKGDAVLRQDGKPKYRKSYSVLQDELFEHMQEHGFKGFQRGELGSDSEHLTSLRYQINADKDRLAEIQERIQQEQINYEPAHEVFLTANEIEETGQKTLTGKISMSKEDYTKITSLAKEGITSRGEIRRLNDNVEYYRNSYYRSASALDRMQNLYDDLKEKCKPFLVAMEHFPDLVKIFVDKVKELFTAKEERERQEKAARDIARKQKHESTRSRDDWSR
ncbi:MAG TPA: plasmid recombination protein [Eubacteriales bacterium]|nr:plasmid recombination protein [Eubacteriales bacterium]